MASRFKSFSTKNIRLQMQAEQGVGSVTSNTNTPITDDTPVTVTSTVGELKQVAPKLVSAGLKAAGQESIPQSEQASGFSPTISQSTTIPEKPATASPPSSKPKESEDKKKKPSFWLTASDPGGLAPHTLALNGGRAGGITGAIFS
jgi:hypothetical protein